MAKAKGFTGISDSTEVTVVSRLGDWIIVEDMYYGEALMLSRVGGWHHLFYQLGFTSVKGNTKDRSLLLTKEKSIVPEVPKPLKVFSPIPLPPPVIKAI